MLIAVKFSRNKKNWNQVSSPENLRDEGRRVLRKIEIPCVGEWIVRRSTVTHAWEVVLC